MYASTTFQVVYHAALLAALLGLLVAPLALVGGAALHLWLLVTGQSLARRK